MMLSWLWKIVGGSKQHRGIPPLLMGLILTVLWPYIEGMKNSLIDTRKWLESFCLLFVKICPGQKRMHKRQLWAVEYRSKAAQNGGKLPNVPALQAEYEKLQAQKESLSASFSGFCVGCPVDSL